jgi:hypothetical protein
MILAAMREKVNKKIGNKDKDEESKIHYRLFFYINIY